MAMKIDMSKAYDRVEWPFLKAMLIRLGFGERLTRLIMECAKTFSYSVLVNGKLDKRIIPYRGLRQGDSLFPYLFFICVEGYANYFLKLGGKV